MPARARGAVAALFALDATLGRIVASTTEPMLGQMRLTWWHDALVRLDSAPPPAEPVLSALAAQALPSGVSGAELAAMTDGWEVLLEPIDDAAMRRHGVERGGRLFALAARCCGGGMDVSEAGAGWAIAELARRSSNAVSAQRAAALAGPLLDAAPQRWPRNLRGLGALTLLARLDLAVPLRTAPPVGAPGRVLRLLRHRLTGR